MNQVSEAKKEADLHWAFIEGLLRAHGTSEESIVMCKYHYTSAFVHGWKHAEEIHAECVSNPEIINRAALILKS